MLMLKEPKWPNALHQGERDTKGGHWFPESPMTLRHFQFSFNNDKVWYVAILSPSYILNDIVHDACFKSLNVAK